MDESYQQLLLFEVAADRRLRMTAASDEPLALRRIQQEEPLVHIDRCSLWLWHDRLCILVRAVGNGQTHPPSAHSSNEL